MFRRIVLTVLSKIPNFVNPTDFGHVTQRQPGTKEEPIIKAIYDDIARELGLGLGQSFNPKGDYDVTRTLLESIVGGCYSYKSCGTFSVSQFTNPAIPGVIQDIVKDERTFDGWMYESNIASNTNGGQSAT